MPLTQQEADYLLRLEKQFTNDEPFSFGPPPIRWTRDLVAKDQRERFLFDFWRGSIVLLRYKQQLRHAPSEILLRFESGGRHTNPPGNPHYVGSLDGPHVHLYREGYDDRIAFPVREIGVRQPDNMVSTFEDICRYCSVPTPKGLQGSLI